MAHEKMEIDREFEDFNFFIFWDFKMFFYFLDFKMFFILFFLIVDFERVFKNGPILTVEF